jgi:hypothetical protein
VNKLRTFARFWYEFLVGDDWRLAVGVVATLMATWLLVARTSTNPWWLEVAALAAMLAGSIWHAAGPRGAGGARKRKR